MLMHSDTKNSVTAGRQRTLPYSRTAPARTGFGDDITGPALNRPSSRYRGPHLNRPVVLVVDDDRSLLNLLSLELEDHGFEVLVSTGGPGTMRLFQEYRPDVVVLDETLPEMTGLELMRMIRQQRRIPVVMISGISHVEFRVRALELGADDFLPKPFSPDELSARIRALLRRMKNGEQRRLRFGALQIDLESGRIWRDGISVRLTATEWQLLRYFAANPGRVIDPVELLSKVWGPAYREQVHHVRVWVSRLRRKLEEDPAHPRVIKTVVGLGYMLEHPDEEAVPTLSA